MQNVTITPRAALMAVDSSQTITISAVSNTGRVIPRDSLAVTFKSANASTVSVTADGVVTALRSTTSPIQVTVTVKYGLVTQSQIVYISATPTPASIAYVTVTPQSGETFVNGTVATPTITGYAADSTVVATNIFAYLWSEGPAAIVTADYMMIQFYSPANDAPVGLSFTAYGVPYTDTLNYKISDLTEATLNINPGTSPDSITALLQFAYHRLYMAPGGVLTVTNHTTSSATVTFTPAVDGGTMTLAPNETATRTLGTARGTTYTIDITAGAAQATAGVLIRQ
jgi:hypothetical protein